MKRIVWLTDIHLNFVKPGRYASFTGAINSHYPDIVLIGGDISEAPTVSRDLNLLADYIQKPIYFVLGNHDYYRGSIADVRKEIAELSEESEYLTWLPLAGVLEIGSSTALIGHGGWGDARAGDFFTSTAPLSDYKLIHDFKGMPKLLLQRKLNELGDEAADFVHDILPKALDDYETVYFLTHSPPFRQACTHNGHISDDNWAPHFICKSVGDALLSVMTERQDRRCIVLAGHSHSSCYVEILPNLTVFTGVAIYGRPGIAKILEIE